MSSFFYATDDADVSASSNTYETDESSYPSSWSRFDSDSVFDSSYSRSSTEANSSISSERTRSNSETDVSEDTIFSSIDTRPAVVSEFSVNSVRSLVMSEPSDVFDLEDARNERANSEPPSLADTEPLEEDAGDLFLPAPAYNQPNVENEPPEAVTDEGVYPEDEALSDDEQPNVENDLPEAVMDHNEDTLPYEPPILLLERYEQLLKAISDINTSNLHAFEAVRVPLQDFLDKTNECIQADMTAQRLEHDTILKERVEAWLAQGDQGFKNRFRECNEAITQLKDVFQEVYKAGRGISGSPSSNQPPAKMQKLQGRKRSHSPSDDMDGSTCTICLDAWSNSGQHRLVSLKCGHLFGMTCLVRWLKSQRGADKCCPTCKSKATLKDMRYIYARKLVASDTHEIELMKTQVEQAQNEKNRAELELQKSLLDQRLYLQQVAELRASLKQHESSKVNTATNSAKYWRFALEKNMELGKEAFCRVLAYNCRKYELCISQKSTNALFQGYGIKKVNCLDFKSGSFVFLHPKMIRDLSFSHQNDLLLTASLDKTAKLVSGQNSNVVHTVTTESSLWSCAWDFLIPDKFYLGGPGGSCYQYDIRQTSNYVQRFDDASDLSPVIRLAATQDGFLACRLNSLCLYSRQIDGSFKPHKLPISGPFGCMSYDNSTNQILVSTRPCVQNNRCKHTLCTVNVDMDANVSFNIVNSFLGSSLQTVMSRTCQFRVESDNFVAAHSETDTSVEIYSVNTMTKVQSLKSYDNMILDICPLGFNGDNYLAALSCNRLKVYKAVLSGN